MNYVNLLKALGDESRFRILQLLLSQDLCVGALARRVGLSKPAVSQHLQVLRKAGLIRGEKRGYWTHYMVDRDALLDLARQIADMASQKGRQEAACFRTLCSQSQLVTERRMDAMCCQDCCQHPEHLQGKPQECTPEQIRECHGDVEKHPCEEVKEDK